MKIGFEQQTHTFYEGFPNLHGANPLSPTITFTQATFISDFDTGLNNIAEGIGPNNYEYLFREDSFDPVTKIRRGRFYQPDTSVSNPTSTVVMPRYGLEASVSNAKSELAIKKNLRVFEITRIKERFSKPSVWPLVALGWKSSPTFWNIIQIENISTGEELVYLRSRNSLSILPNLNLNDVSFSSEDKNAIQRKFASLLNDLHTSTAPSIVDHCRDLAEVLLRSKIRQKDPSHGGGELSDLIKTFSKEYGNDFRMIRHYSEIIRNFHQRRKTSLQEIYKTRPILEEDAELTVSCISSMIRDLGLERVSQNFL